MDSKRILSRQWILFGSLSGIFSFILFPILLFADLPGPMEIAFAGIFGIAFSLSGFAIHHAMRFHMTSILTQISALFIFVSGFLYNLMLTVQLTFRGYLSHFRKQEISQEEVDLLDWIAKTVDPVHLGMQVSNDYFLGLAMILFGVSMFYHPFFGKVWAISSSLIGLLLLGVKFWAFPMTPYEQGFPFILGPMISFWFLAANIQCLRVRNKLIQS